jgi:hypothetical protein
MAATSNDVANEALQLCGDDQPFVTGQAPTWDNSTPGKALQKLYGPVVATVQRQWGWDASRALVALTLSATPAPPPWFSLEYLYPSNGIEVWQLVPAALVDPNNPLPVNWDVGNNQVSGVQTKVIWTNLANAQALYNNNPSEAVWDPLFREAVVRLLTSGLSMALAGRPDFLEAALQQAAGFAELAQSRPD